MSVYERLSESQQFACRVIADHARSTAFAIADGILPGNEGRNYVLRKIMRRAIYHGREHLNLTEPFFYKVCNFVVDQMHDAFPELETQRDFIGKMVRLEEERFGSTLSVGLQRQQELFKEGIREIKSLDERLSAVSAEYLTRCFDQDQKPDKELLNEKIQAELKRHFEKFGGGDQYDRMARLCMKLEVAPDEAQAIISSIDPDDNWSGLFLAALPFVLSQEGPQHEKDLVRAVFSLPLDYAEQKAFFVTYLKTKFADQVKLYDTFGYPRDLIRVGLEDWAGELPEAEFDAAFDSTLESLQEQTGVGKTERKSEVSPVYSAVLEKIGANEFHGYEATQLEDTKVVAILDGEKQIDELRESAQGSVVLDQTPFYAESGGQVGDVGKLTSTDAHATVADTYSPVAGLIIHKVTVDKGSIKVGDTVIATVDIEKRDATRRNHTATHLVHAALKEVLGSHVKQAGSVVAPSYLRFDFTHYQPMSDGEIAEIEDLVNRYILQNEPVTTDVMALEDAMRSGAVAMFGEKYGGEVRVLSVGGGEFSKELCGGTHVRSTGDIGSFKITSDEAIASGVRRIRAITGFDAFERFREDERLIDASLSALNTQRDNLPNAIAKLADELKRTRREMDDLKLKIALGGGQGSVAGGQSSNGDETRDINGVKVLGKIVDGLDANGTRQLSDTLLARLKSGIVVLGRKDDGKVGIIVRVSDDLTSKVKAGDVIREIAPIVGGKGGGKADMAEGGGTDPDKLGDAIDASYSVIESFLSK